MNLYAVKVNDQYLRDRGDHIELVSMAKASVYQTIDDAKKLQAIYGKGNIYRLILTEEPVE